jgi:hypothetical protein
MHLPSLKDATVAGACYVAVCAVLCNVLPKDSIFDGYPRTKKAYNATVLFLAVSAFNLRKCLPGANIKIPFLGFGQYQHDHPELFADGLSTPTKQPGVTP